MDNFSDPTNATVTSNTKPINGFIKSKLVVLNLNIRSLSKNFDLLLCLIDSLVDKPSVIALTETWLNDDSPVNGYQISGYHPLISKHRNTRGGGVAFFIN